LNKERRLGRGLEALLGRVAGKADPLSEPSGGPSVGSPDDPGPTASEPLQSPESAPPEQHDRSPAGDHVPVDTTPSGEPQSSPSDAGPGETGQIKVEVRAIDSNPFQPRQDFDPGEIQSLSDSLRAHGLLQPLVVRRVGDRYQLIAGERRLQAAAKAGWTEVPVHVVDADDRKVAELAIVENLQRKDLNPLEKAASFQRYLQEYGGTQDELAARLKLDRSTIANLIRLLELPDAVQEAIRQGKITQGHARALLPLGDEREQVEFCGRIEREGLNVRRTESLVQEAIAEADAEPLGVLRRDGTTARPRRMRSEHLAALEGEFRIALGTRVKITHGSRGRGKLTIHFASHEEFERLRRHICVPAQPYPQGQVG